MLQSVPSLFPKGRYKPTGIPIINWNDPRTLGLVKAFILNGNMAPFDLVNFTVATATGTVTPRASHGGQNAYFQGQDNALTNYYTVKSGTILGGQASFSVIAGAALLSTHNTTGGGSYTIYSERATSGNDILKLCMSTGTANTSPINFTYRNDAGTLIQPKSASNSNDGLFHVYALTKNGSGSNNANVFTDGKNVATASWNTNDTFTNASIKSTIGGDVGDTTSGYPDYIHFVYLYNISLSTAIISSLSADPYGFLIFPQDQIFAQVRKPAATAGTIIPLPWMQTSGGMMDLTGGMRN